MTHDYQYVIEMSFMNKCAGAKENVDFLLSNVVNSGSDHETSDISYFQTNLSNSYWIDNFIFPLDLMTNKDAVQLLSNALQKFKFKSENNCVMFDHAVVTKISGMLGKEISVITGHKVRRY